jgi:hypothetical protein
MIEALADIAEKNRVKLSTEPIGLRIYTRPLNCKKENSICVAHLWQDIALF